MTLRDDVLKQPEGQICYANLAHIQVHGCVGMVPYQERWYEA